MINVEVVKVESITTHPEADHLSVVQMSNGKQVVTMKEEFTNEFRFQREEIVVFVPERAVIPDAILQQTGFWDEDKKKGMLAGAQGNRVKAAKFRGILSEGLIWKGVCFPNDDYGTFFNDQVAKSASVGDNLADFFEIKEFTP